MGAMGHDFVVEIRAGSSVASYEVEVESPAGPAAATMQLDYAGILRRRRELAASVLASAATSRSAFSTLERPVRDVGRTLFEALFTSRVYDLYTASLSEAGRRGEALRVVLRLRDQELAGIPWETLFDPESGEYLCQREPVVRYVEAAQSSAPLSATGPLRILAIVAAPSDLPTFDTAEERRRLDDALVELVDQGLVEMVWVDAGNWSALQSKLTAGPWHVLHVIAHGGASDRGAVLALENEATGAAAQVSVQRFARLLHACRPVPRLVVLNACSSGEAAADDLLSSTAAALVHSGISAAVAMQFAVTDPAALAFSRGFYQALAQSIAVDEAVRLGRIALGGTSEQTLEWVTPVIYLRTDDTRLFDLTSTGAPASMPAPEEISNEASKYGLYVQALAASRKDRYDEAVALLDSLITLDPGYRDATELRNRMRQEQMLGASYQKARAAEDAGDIEAARRGYRSVIDLDPTHRDAQNRHDEAERLLIIASLKDELRVHASAEDWDAVLAVSAELARLDPDSADPERLATRAQEKATPQQPQASRPTKGDGLEPSVAWVEPGRSREIDAPPVVDENVQFTVYRPQAIRPGVWYPMLAFAHLAEPRPDAATDAPDPIEQVRALAHQALGNRASAYASPSSDSRGAIPKEGDLTFVPTMDGVEFNPPRRVFRWLEDVHKEEFRLRVDAGHEGSVLRGQLTVFLGAFILADVNLAIKLEESAAPPPAAQASPGVASPPDFEPAHASPYRKIFPSYSHRDSDIVEQAQRLGAAMGDVYLRDRTALRSGEEWSARLLELIDEADVFQLFWSSHSMRSEYVRREWEYAESLARRNFIRPTYWEEPMPHSDDPLMPPDSLQSLHFHCLTLAASPARRPLDEVESKAPAAAAPSAPQPSLPPSNRSPDSSALICPTCGGENQSDTDFCGQCGSYLAWDDRGRVPGGLAPPAPADAQSAPPPGQPYSPRPVDSASAESQYAYPPEDDYPMARRSAPVRALVVVLLPAFVVILTFLVWLKYAH